MFTAADLASGADGPYWQAMLEGRIDLPKCTGCGKWHWPAVWRCSSCGGWEHGWHPVALDGTIYSWTRTWHPFPGLESIEKPFVIAVVSLPAAGDIRLFGILEAAADAPVRIGAAVKGHVGETEYNAATYPALRWRLAG